MLGAGTINWHRPIFHMAVTLYRGGGDSLDLMIHNVVRQNALIESYVFALLDGGHLGFLVQNDIITSSWCQKRNPRGRLTRKSVLYIILGAVAQFWFKSQFFKMADGGHFVFLCQNNVITSSWCQICNPRGRLTRKSVFMHDSTCSSSILVQNLIFQDGRWQPSWISVSKWCHNVNLMSESESSWSTYPKKCLYTWF